MQGLIRLIEALILGGSVGTKFVFGSSAVRLKPVVDGGCSLHEKVLAAESNVQVGHLICAWIGSEGSCPLWEKVPAAKSAMQACLSQREWDGSEGRDGDGSERLCNSRVHRPAVAVQEEGSPCGIRVAGDVNDRTEWGNLLGKRAYWMLIHIFWGIDEAGIGPAGPRCGANSWATSATSLEGIGLSSGELWPLSLFWGIDEAGIGPAGTRCGANSWATTTFHDLKTCL